MNRTGSGAVRRAVSGDANAARLRRAMPGNASVARLRRTGVALFSSIVLSGCGSGLPLLSPSGEPLAVNPHVTSVRIDPRTLKPVRPGPDDAEAYYQRGNAYARRGDVDRAKRDFEEAVKLDPKGEAGRRAREALRRLEGVLERRGPSPSR